MEKKVLQDVGNICDRQLLETIESLKNLQLFSDIVASAQCDSSYSDSLLLVNNNQPNQASQNLSKSKNDDELYSKNRNQSKSSKLICNHNSNSNHASLVNGSADLQNNSSLIEEQECQLCANAIINGSTSASAPVSDCGSSQDSVNSDYDQQQQYLQNQMTRDQYINQGSQIITSRVSQAQNLDQASEILTSSLQEYTDEYDRQGFGKQAIDSAASKIINTLQQENKILKKGMTILNSRYQEQERLKIQNQQELKNKDTQIQIMRETINKLTAMISNRGGQQALINNGFTDFQ
eukprot:403347834